MLNPFNNCKELTKYQLLSQQGLEYTDCIILSRKVRQNIYLDEYMSVWNFVVAWKGSATSISYHLGILTQWILLTHSHHPSLSAIIPGKYSR